MNTTLTPRQLGAVLAALRLWQRLGESQGRPEFGIATNEGEFEPLDDSEIDGLCETINMAGSLADATPSEIARARERYAVDSDDDIQVDDDAKASHADDGCFVQAWVWLPQEKDAVPPASGAKAAPCAHANARPQQLAQMETITSVMLQDVVGDYETPDEMPEWTWIREQASYAHCHNGSDGIWEFVLNLHKHLEGAPSQLQEVIDLARASGAGYLLIHQGT